VLFTHIRSSLSHVKRECLWISLPGRIFLGVRNRGAPVPVARSSGRNSQKEDGEKRVHRVQPATSRSSLSTLLHKMPAAAGEGLPTAL
jgi:hypothetical protein